MFVGHLKSTQKLQLNGSTQNVILIATLPQLSIIYRLIISAFEITEKSPATDAEADRG